MVGKDLGVPGVQLIMLSVVGCRDIVEFVNIDITNDVLTTAHRIADSAILLSGGHEVKEEGREPTRNYCVQCEHTLRASHIKCSNCSSRKK